MQSHHSLWILIIREVPILLQGKPKQIAQTWCTLLFIRVERAKLVFSCEIRMHIDLHRAIFFQLRDSQNSSDHVHFFKEKTVCFDWSHAGETWRRINPQNFSPQSRFWIKRGRAFPFLAPPRPACSSFTHFRIHVPPSFVSFFLYVLSACITCRASGNRQTMPDSRIYRKTILRYDIYITLFLNYIF